MPIPNVMLVGANGKLGPFILRALLDAKAFKVTVLTRASSKSQYPAEVQQARVPDALPYEELLEAFRGQDALVIAFSGSQASESLKLIDVAAEAGIKRIIPNDFGSMDSSDPFALELIPYYSQKQVVREHLMQVAQRGDLSWTALVTGHFFDFGLKTELLAVNVSERKATIFDDGNVRWSATLESTIGTAVARVLQNEETFRNRMVYIQSISMTQNEFLEALERVTGEKFRVENVSSEQYIKEHKELLQTKGMDHDVIEELVAVGGIIDADWEKKADFVNQELDLPQENLDDLIKGVLQQKS